MKLSLLRIIFIFLIIQFACKNDKLDIDVSNIALEVKIKRFDKDVSHCSTIEPDSVYKYITILERKYGRFFELYIYKIIKYYGEKSTKAYADHLNRFLNDDVIREVHKKCHELFTDVEDLNNQLTQAFKHYKHYFPEKSIPEVYTYISGFNQSIVTDSNILGIGIDKYLGKDCEYYAMLRLPRYMRYKMHGKKIVSDCMIAWAYTEFEFNDSIDNLLSNMIYQGKVMYFTDAMLPDVPDTLKMGYSLKQLKWCEMNEEKMWSFLIENKQLFITGYIDIKKYINDGPFTPNFSRQSPSRTGIWMGWQIVKAYMKNNPNISLKELMNEDDFQKILNLSKYKPG